MAEKTEKPTDKRRKESAKKGQTFKSKDLITTVTLLTGIYFIKDFFSFREFVDFYVRTLQAVQDINIKDYFSTLLRLLTLLVIPFVAVCCVVGLAITFFQTRFTIATEALNLNFKALNPVEGFKRIFSLRTVKELVKSIFYMFVFVAAYYNFLSENYRDILQATYESVPGLIFLWSGLTVKIIVIFIAFSAIIQLGDFITEYFLHNKDLKMDKHEVKQERKESDGNPEIKKRRRRTHQEILSGEEQLAIKNSQVVLANPTHIAIAIYFNPDVAALPFVALRAKNMKAKAAIAYAEKNGVPVVRYIPLARALFRQYKTYSFISLSDKLLLDVMDILIWLRQVELAETNNTLGNKEVEQLHDN